MEPRRLMRSGFDPLKAGAVGLLFFAMLSAVAPLAGQQTVEDSVRVDASASVQQSVSSEVKNPAMISASQGHGGPLPAFGVPDIIPAREGASFSGNRENRTKSDIREHAAGAGALTQVSGQANVINGFRSTQVVEGVTESLSEQRSSAQASSAVPHRSAGAVEFQTASGSSSAGRYASAFTSSRTPSIVARSVPAWGVGGERTRSSSGGRIRASESSTGGSSSSQSSPHGGMVRHGMNTGQSAHGPASRGPRMASRHGPHSGRRISGQ